MLAELQFAIVPLTLLEGHKKSNHMDAFISSEKLLKVFSSMSLKCLKLMPVYKLYIEFNASTVSTLKN